MSSSRWRSMKAVVASPFAKAGCRRQEIRKLWLVVTPKAIARSRPRDQPPARLLAGRAEADELGDHRIVKWRDLRSGLQRMFDAERLRHLPQRHPPRLRHEIMACIFRAQPDFDRVPRECDVLLPQRQRLAGRDAQLQFDQIEPGDRFGDGMFDLQTCVHFHEIELPALRRAGTPACRRPRNRSPSPRRPRPRPSWRAIPARPPATAPPRSASDGAAAPNNRVRRDGWR